ncbi:hypothetical protein V6N13_139949 [Hibiscus sabdariffa]|uniref:Uncharacterized protein n=1 Tax=Hibiscus sabdariffa TaxID=183260 RepID=A0ABR2AMS4_9ROSI
MRKLAESLFLSVGFSVDELTHFESKTGTLMRCLGLHQTPTEQTHPLFCLLSFLSDMLIDDSLVYAIKELQVQKRFALLVYLTSSPKRLAEYTTSRLNHIQPIFFKQLTLAASSALSSPQMSVHAHSSCKQRSRPVLRVLGQAMLRDGWGICAADEQDSASHGKQKHCFHNKAAAAAAAAV